MKDIDPEELTPEDIEEIIRVLSETLKRYRKARGNVQPVQEAPADGS